VVELLVISGALAVDPLELFAEIARLAALSRATVPPALGFIWVRQRNTCSHLNDPPGVAALLVDRRSLTS